MSARYGSRTRSGEAVSDLGRRAEAGGGGDPRLGTEYEEIFTSPGTWTNPGTVTWVEVFMVGGGGGGGAGGSGTPADNYQGGGGGGGGRIIDWTDFEVSGPQPVVVGAGGVGGVRSPAVTHGSVGGDSTFGAPGPTQMIAGGGGGGKPGNPSVPGSISSPLTGGGGGGGAGTSSGGFGRYGGAGSPSYNTSSPIDGRMHTGQGGGARTSAVMHTAGRGWKGLGGGGMCAGQFFVNGPYGAVDGGGVGSWNSWPAPMYPLVIHGRANTGGGGAGGHHSSNSQIGGDGGSGLVIVRWWE